MKIVKMTESIQDDIELKALMAEKAKIDAYAKKIQDKIRSIVYKYDSVRIDYSKKF
jgi:hypothetical protein